MREEREGFEETPEPGWAERLSRLGAAARRLLETRASIFREEIEQKRALAARAAVGLLAALLFGSLALLVATALFVAILSRLLGGPVAGIAVTLLVYVAAAAAGAIYGWSRLSRVRPLDFPVTRREISRDIDRLARAAAGPAGRPAPERPGPQGPPSGSAREESPEELEARLREGAG